jgi:hypothetical protein
MGLHPTFHVGLLKPYLRNSLFNRGTPSRQPDVFEDGHEEWEREVMNSCLPARQLGNTKDLGRTILSGHDFDAKKPFAGSARCTYCSRRGSDW